MIFYENIEMVNYYVMLRVRTPWKIKGYHFVLDFST